MSNSLHVASKYEVHYGTVSSFKNKENAFKRLIDYFDMNWAGNYPENFEIYKDEWKDVIRILKIRKVRNVLDGELGNILKDFGIDISTLIELMEVFLNQSDPNNDYLTLAFF